jgi:predicted molibdopterin-dependent oxidoreductase YjgC
MSTEISLTIDGQAVSVPAGTTILKAAETLGTAIPTICYHEHCTSNALCRICVVEVEGARVLAAACVAQVSEGMQVRTQTERVNRSRRTIWRCSTRRWICRKRPKSDLYGRLCGRPERFPEAEQREPA